MEWAENATSPREVPSFEVIYEDYADFLYAALRRLGLSPTGAEDALQDVFLVVHRRLHTFEGRGSLRSWLYGVAVRVARDHGRRRKIWARFFSSEETEVDPAAPASSDPQRALEAAEDLRRLDQILGRLPAAQREVFVLIEISGLSAPEVAQALELNLNTVYSRLRLARQEIHAVFRREQETGND